ARCARRDHLRGGPAAVLVRPPLSAAATARPGLLKAVAWRTLAAFLVLWTPFLVFTAYRGYPLPATALLCSAAVAAGVAAVLSLLCGRAGGKRQAVLFALLVAVALDIQFDWFRGIAAYVVIGLLLVIFWLLRRHLAAILATMFGAV